MHEDCLNIAQKISEDPILNTYSPLLVGGKLRDDPIFSVAMKMNGFVCHAKPEYSKCIALPLKYTIDKIDIIEGKLDVTDKNDKEFKDCALLHFSTRKALEEGLYLWQTILVGLKKRNSKLLYKLANNKTFWILCSCFRFIKTKVKHLF